METSSLWSAWLQGYALSFGLIVAIGAQNAFVLRQGLKREHISWVVAFCAGVDALLIFTGVFGMAALLSQAPWLSIVLASMGVVFLSAYGWQAAKRARIDSALYADQSAGALTLSAALAQAAAFTLFNPHVYLDTVLLVGGIGAQLEVKAQWWFALGAAAASVSWFCCLGFGARLLAPVFQQPLAWRILDLLIAMVMWGLAFGLIISLIQGDFGRFP